MAARDSASMWRSGGSAQAIRSSRVIGLGALLTISLILQSLESAQSDQITSLRGRRSIRTTAHGVWAAKKTSVFSFQICSPQTMFSRGDARQKRARFWHKNGLWRRRVIRPGKICSEQMVPGRPLSRWALAHGCA